MKGCVAQPTPFAPVIGGSRKGTLSNVNIDQLAAKSAAASIDAAITCTISNPAVVVIKFSGRKLESRNYEQDSFTLENLAKFRTSRQRFTRLRK